MNDSKEFEGFDWIKEERNIKAIVNNKKVKSISINTKNSFSEKRISNEYISFYISFFHFH